MRLFFVLVLIECPLDKAVSARRDDRSDLFGLKVVEDGVGIVCFVGTSSFSRRCTIRLLKTENQVLSMLDEEIARNEQKA